MLWQRLSVCNVHMMYTYTHMVYVCTRSVYACMLVCFMYKRIQLLYADVLCVVGVLHTRNGLLGLCVCTLNINIHVHRIYALLCHHTSINDCASTTCNRFASHLKFLKHNITRRKRESERERARENSKTQQQNEKLMFSVDLKISAIWPFPLKNCIVIGYKNEKKTATTIATCTNDEQHNNGLFFKKPGFCVEKSGPFEVMPW